jgi:hypothetical protein
MQIDYGRIVAMRKIGFSYTKIAERLECSDKQVARIADRLNLKTHHVCIIDDILDTPYEHALWHVYFNKVKSYGRVAYAFGVTRQRVQQVLSQKEAQA